MSTQNRRNSPGSHIPHITYCLIPLSGDSTASPHTELVVGEPLWGELHTEWEQCYDIMNESANRSLSSSVYLRTDLNNDDSPSTSPQMRQEGSEDELNRRLLALIKQQSQSTHDGSSFDITPMSPERHCFRLRQVGNDKSPSDKIFSNEHVRLNQPYGTQLSWGSLADIGDLPLHSPQI